MKVGILGSGNVGQALALGFMKHGYDVMIGSRDKAKLKEWNEKIGNKARLGDFAETVKFGDILVLAVKGTAAKDALKIAGAENLSGKIMIDTTNPIADSPPENGVLRFFTTLNKSLMEDLQAEYSDVRFVKAFSCIGSAFMVNPEFHGQKPAMFFCGNDENAKATVRQVLVQFGFEPEDMGKAEAARAIEPLCMLWCIPGFLRNDWAHAFKVLKV
jgi:8-hydroxy-5-deazaflavin:NADPH oxidoreductase